MNNILNVISKTYYENSYSTDIFFTVQDVCGPIYLWPIYIKQIIASKTFNYSERIKLLTFFWVNGYRNNEGWLQFIIKIKGPGFLRYDKEIFNLFKYLHREEIQHNYFSYCVTHEQYEYLDGSKRDVPDK